MKWDEAPKLQDSRSLLVVDPAGRLRQLYVPFSVQCIEQLERIPQNTRVYVDRVVMHPKHRLIYEVHQRFYPYQYFRINLLY